jgi:hypothetical protein
MLVKSSNSSASALLLPNLFPPAVLKIITYPTATDTGKPLVLDRFVLTIDPQFVEASTPTADNTTLVKVGTVFEDSQRRLGVCHNSVSATLSFPSDAARDQRETHSFRLAVKSQFSVFTLLFERLHSVNHPVKFDPIIPPADKLVACGVGKLDSAHSGIVCKRHTTSSARVIISTVVVVALSETIAGWQDAIRFSFIENTIYYFNSHPIDQQENECSQHSLPRVCAGCILPDSEGRVAARGSRDPVCRSGFVCGRGFCEPIGVFG